MLSALVELRALSWPAIGARLGAFLAVASLAAWFVGWLRRSKRVRAPYTRKLYHFTIFTLAGLVQLQAGLGHVMLFGAAVSLLVCYAVLRGDGFSFYEALARPSDAPHRTFFILVPLATTAAGGLLASLLFGSMAFIGYLVAGWGDAVGEPVGTAWGRHRYTIPSLAGVPCTRSVEGSAAVALAGMAAACAGLALQGVSAPAALGAGALCGLAAAAVEAVSHHGLDNLTVQLAASGVAHFLLGPGSA